MGPQAPSFTYRMLVFGFFYFGLMKLLKEYQCVCCYVLHCVHQLVAECVWSCTDKAQSVLRGTVFTGTAACCGRRWHRENQKNEFQRIICGFITTRKLQKNLVCLCFMPYLKRTCRVKRSCGMRGSSKHTGMPSCSGAFTCSHRCMKANGLAAQLTKTSIWEQAALDISEKPDQNQKSHFPTCHL